MNTFPLQILTPDGCAFDGEAEKLFCRTIEGDLCILARHCDYCSAVGMGEAHVLVDGKTRYAACMGGMLSVMGGKARLLATTWEWAEDIDKERAEASKARAEEALHQENLDKREMEMAEARLKRALVRESVAK
ncbi:MAG: ATP synthase F1 subunit epsilon [Faecalibacterium sp.]|jgi:F-type H+-transporting ATPase subunit epsilon|nr:ATP synthase F1 subunit epsilon [Faecalibacterium sp.]